jgi:hypothetical protein
MDLSLAGGVARGETGALCVSFVASCIEHSTQIRELTTMKLTIATALLALSLAGCAGGGNILAGAAGTSANSSTWGKDVWRDAERSSGGG